MNNGAWKPVALVLLSSTSLQFGLAIAATTFDAAGPLTAVWIRSVVGALLLGLGLVYLLLGLLRLIQTQWTTVASGGWSWVPYMIVLVACLLLLILIVSRINRDSLK